MVKNLGKKYKYGDQPIRAITIQIIANQFGGAATAKQVDDYLRKLFPSYKDNTWLNLIANTVNCKRSYWSFNKTARRTDDVTHRHHKYDRLFKRGNIFEIYQPSVHGIWELYQDLEGMWRYRQVKSVFEEAVGTAAKLSSVERKCQYCKRDAPFLKEDGTPFLEVHHIEWLSKGGEDSVENAIALCPNCHRQAHYGDLTLLPVNK